MPASSIPFAITARSNLFSENSMSIIAGSHLRSLTRLSSLVGIAALAACSDQTPANLVAPDQTLESRGTSELHGSDDGAVFVTTNAANGNEVKAFSRAADGSLSPLGTFATGGTGVGGVGDPLTSQGAAALSPDHKLLFVVNAGSNDVSVFRIKKDGLKLVDRESSAGVFPVSIAASKDAVYVLNAGSSEVEIFSYNESGNLRARGRAALSPNTSGPTELRLSPKT